MSAKKKMVTVQIEVPSYAIRAAMKHADHIVSMVEAEQPRQSASTPPQFLVRSVTIR